MSIMEPAPAAIPSRLLYSPSETETLLGLSHATLYRLVRAGCLDAVKIGSATRITQASIERFVSSLPAAVGASPQAGTASGNDGPGAGDRGAQLRRSRSRSLRHRRNRADEPARADPSG
jgi:excisionase family DNA binding protein